MSLTCYYVRLMRPDVMYMSVTKGLCARSWIYCKCIQPVYRRRGDCTQVMNIVRL